jgi:hypothetical protein
MGSKMRIVTLAVALVGINRVQAQPAPQATGRTVRVTAEISNKLITAQLHLPDLEEGFYRGTRFDWSGIIGKLVYRGHNYYGPWFTRVDPTVYDFTFQGADIVAGSCGAITGPVEEFSTDGKALGYDDAPPGGTFIKIGVGVLRKPEAGGSYSPYHLYQIVDPGTWNVQPGADSVAFTHSLADATSGYGYRYEKTIRLVPGRPEMVIEHRLTNTGKRRLATSVYNHNFLVLDGQQAGPDFLVKMPFEIKAAQTRNGALADASGNQIVFKTTLRDRDVVYTAFQGFGTTAADNGFTIENKRVGAGLQVTGDRPLSKMALWSIRTVVSIEPFVTMTIDPAGEFSWQYTYRYYVLDGRGH